MSIFAGPLAGINAQPPRRQADMTTVLPRKLHQLATTTPARCPNRVLQELG
jgi:hypothetical protein